MDINTEAKNIWKEKLFLHNQDHIFKKCITIPCIINNMLFITSLFKNMFELSIETNVAMSKRQLKIFNEQEYG